ncbi:MAG: hypothetical protein ABIT71_24125 [Vicinamibacteraceae bacterium]
MPPPVPAISGDGVLTRFSTTVENSVEISGLSRLAAIKTLVLSVSAYGEGVFVAFFSTISAS